MDEFPKLEELTIVLYPSDDIEPDSHIDSVKAKEGSLHGKRCEWGTASAIKLLQVCKSAEVLNWKMAQVNTLIRLFSTYEDDEIDPEPDISNSDYEDEEAEFDSEWYQQAETKLSKRVSKEDSFSNG
jgi:hypothetical protein